VDAGCGVGARIAECCYECATELKRDDDEGVRLAVVWLVRCCHFVGVLLCLYVFGGVKDFQIWGVELINLLLLWIGSPMCSEVCCENGYRCQGPWWPHGLDFPTGMVHHTIQICITLGLNGKKNKHSLMNITLRCFWLSTAFDIFVLVRLYFPLVIIISHHPKSF